MKKATFNLSKEELGDLYINRQLGTVKIGERLGLSYQSVRNWLIKYEIPIRSPSEAAKIVQKDCKAKQLISKKEAIDLYFNLGLNISQIAEKFNIAGSTVSNLFKCYNIQTFRCPNERFKPEKDVLSKFYFQDNFNTEKISKIFGVGESAIYKWLDEYNLFLKRPKFDAVNEECFQCGKIFLMAPSCRRQVDNPFCTPECSTNWRKSLIGDKSQSWNSIEVFCDTCGNKLFRRPSELKNKDHAFCNWACMGIWFSKNKKGENNQNYKGGYEEDYGENWDKQRILRREIDQWICQCCGVHTDELGRNLDVHHCVAFRFFTIARYLEANNLNNLLSFCNRCHKIVEVLTDWKLNDANAITLEEVKLIVTPEFIKKRIMEARDR